MEVYAMELKKYEELKNAIRAEKSG